MADEQGATGAGEGQAGEQKRTFTEDEFNAHSAQLRKSEEAKRTKLQKELDDLREKHKTDAEREMDKVRQERDAHWQGEIKRQAIDAELRLQLQARNLDPDFALLVRNRGEINEAAEVVPAIEAFLKAKPQLVQSVAKQKPGQTGAPGAVPPNGQWGPPWTAEKVRELRAASVRNPRLWAEHGESVRQALIRGEVQ